MGKMYICSMKLLILNGPNLNLLGTREPAIYGSKTFVDFFTELQFKFQNVELAYFQSNIEGEIISKLHEAGQEGYDGILLNAGAYTHTSIGIGDAVAGITTPVIEVHISNVMEREDFRHVSYISKNAVGVIFGFGLKGYELGVKAFLDK